MRKIVVVGVAATHSQWSTVPTFQPVFIRGNHRTAADLGAERLIGRRRARGRARTQLDEPAAGDREAVVRREHAPDFAERQAQALVQPHRECRRARPERGAGRAEGIGRLQRMSPLHPSPAAAARADRHAKGAHHGLDRREIFLILRRDVRGGDRVAAARARRGQARVMGLVDLPRLPAMRAPAVRRAGPPPRRPVPWRCALAKGAAWRNPARRAASS